MRHPFLQALTDLFFPRRCIFCGALLSYDGILCRECENDPQIQPRLFRKWLNREAGGNPILCIVPYRYEGKPRDAIHALKFHRKTAAADFFGNRMALTLRHALPPGSVDVITCVPMSRKKERERGYNQAELLAKSVSREYGLPYEGLLEKFRENRIQHDLDREERVQNVKGVYRVRRPSRAVGKRILLVDDVITTGSTCGECAHVLLEAGAREVICAAATAVIREKESEN